MTPVRPLWARALHAYELRAPNHPGKRTLIALALRLLAAVGAREFAWPVASGALVVVPTIEGLAPFETAGWACFLRGEWEPHVERALRELLREGDTAVDAGANLGYFAIAMAQAVGADGHVAAFEPVPPTFERLRAAAELNGLRQLVAHSIALGASEATVEIGFDPELTAMASAHRVAGERATVTLRPLDALVAEGTVPAPRVIKVDVEGHELEVLRGARDTIERHRPAIVFELNEPMARAARWTLADVARLLDDCGGYELFLLDEARTRLDAAFTPQRDGYADVLALPRAIASR